MKNFKKVLALVLAIATLLSFATVASAATADFSDAADVTNVEALDVLSYIKVLEGYKADNSFKPAKNITREEAAKIIAIFANKSADISSLYTSANPFADEKGRWGESYVAYGYRAGIIAGKSATQFKPTANVKGTEFLKMVLVVLGYDQNKEGLVGSSWAVNTLELAKAKKLMAGLKDFDPNAALTRDQAAQIMLNALKAETVVYGQTVTNLVWNATAGYWTVANNVTPTAAVYVSPNGATNNYEHKLLAAGFGLTLKSTEDAWGRPTHSWLKGTKTIGEYVDSDKLVATFKTAVTECDLAKEVGQTAKEETYAFHVNGATVYTDTIQTLDTVNKVGAQGRLTEVYDDNRIVMIDTFLAKVTAVKDAAFDAAGHVKSESSLTMNVYCYSSAATATTVLVTVTNGSTNFPYAVGDYILVNAYTNSGDRDDAYTVTSGANQYVEILGKATSVEGAQTVIWYNADKHTVNGTVYDDALQFALNEAGTNTGNYTWFFDTYGNLIGAVKIETVYSYGVVTKLYWESAGAGAGKTMADVTYIDGTTNTIEVASFQLKAGETVFTPVADFTAGVNTMKFTQTSTKKANVNVSLSYTVNAAADDATGNSDVIDGHLFRMETLADSKVALVEVANHNSVNSINTTWGWLGDAALAKVDTATKFLVGTVSNGVYTYKAYNGISELPTFTDSASVVDYTKDVNGYAQYVYIIGTPDTEKTNEFVFISSMAYSAQLKTSGGVNYYELALNINDADGNAVTLKVLEANKAKVVDVLTNVANYGKLFYIHTDGGFVDSVEAVSTVGKQFNAKDSGTYAVMKDANASAVYSNGVLRFAGNDVNVVNAEVMVGELDKTKTVDLTDKIIYVVEDWSKHVATKLYIVDNNTPDTPAPLPTKATITYKVEVINSVGADLGGFTVGSQVVTVPADGKVTASYATLLNFVNNGESSFTANPSAKALLVGKTLADVDAKTVTVAAGTTDTVITWTVLQ